MNVDIAMMCAAMLASAMLGVWVSALKRANNHLKNELDRKDDVNLCLRQEIESVKAENRRWLHDLGCFEDLCLFGMNHLGIHEYMDANPTCGVVAVVARDVGHTQMFCIKEFLYEANDPEDRDFAIREANELIEILKS